MMKNFKVIAYHLGNRIDLKAFRLSSKQQLLKREHSFLLYEVAEEAYIYLKDYGSIVFLNCKDDLISQVLNSVIVNNVREDSLLTETYTISFGNTIEVDFDKIQIHELSVDTAHIIMLNLAQSVALKYYLNSAAALHESTLIYAKQLEETGHIKLSKKHMRIFIGKTMNLKNSIAENLFIFDSSDLAWSNESLSKLDYQIKDELDIVNRHNGIQYNLNVIKENLDLFKDILQHKYSSMLEWIIIILILFEVIQVIVEKLI